MKVRSPSVAGMFYTDNVIELKKSLSYLNDYKKKARVTALIVPHAGHFFSGETAGEAYKLISSDYKKVIILAPNHTVYSGKAVVDSNDFWETPLGKVKLWKPKLGDVFVESEVVHKQEHAVEVHLPFLQVVLKDFKLLPVIIGDVNEVSLNKISKEILSLLDKDTLLIISTDLSHFLTEREALEVDNETIDSILKLKDVTSEHACGANPLKVANRIFRELNKKPMFLKYATSADASGDKNRVVGYASFLVE